jgi:hypothetical protein
MAKHKYSKNAADNTKSVQNAADGAKSAQNPTNNSDNAINGAKSAQNTAANAGNNTKNGVNSVDNSQKSAQSPTSKNLSYDAKRGISPTGRLSLRQKGEIVLNSSSRVPVIDNAKGVMIVLMMLLGFGLMNMSADSFLSSHSYLPGVAIRDLITPALMFTVAMSLNSSFKRRAERSGVRAAKRHLLTRGIGYIAVGLVINEIMYFAVHVQYDGNAFTYPYPSISWDILQAVGAALITASFAINMRNQSKILLMLGLLLVPIILTLILPEAVNGYLYSASNLSNGTELKWGGIFSFFVFGAMLIAYDMLTQLAFKDIKKFLLIYAAIVVATAVCIVITPSEEEVLSLIPTGAGITEYAVKYLKNPFIVNFMTLSLGYFFVGISVGASAILIAVVLNYVNDKDYFVFAAVGRNSLLFYLIFIVLSRIIPAFVNAQSIQNGTEISIPWYIPFIVSVAATAAMCFLAEILDRKKIYLKL